MGTPPPPAGDPCSGTSDPPAETTGRIDMALAGSRASTAGRSLISAGGSNKLGLPLDDGWVFQVELASAAAVDFLIRDWDDIDIHGPSDAGLTLALERPAATGPTSWHSTKASAWSSTPCWISMGIGMDGPTFKFLARNSVR